MNPADDDPTALARLLDQPTDLIPTARELTLDTLIRFNDHAGPLTFNAPGEVVLDVDGIPIGVGAAAQWRGRCRGLVVTRAEMDRLRADPADYPNTRVVEP